jgi:hypothetical protein
MIEEKTDRPKLALRDLAEERRYEEKLSRLRRSIV